ncbi:MAG TPA: GAF domain-containing protein [Chloroflexota bacterium]|nr:GAF domain-containing protein [Chloroflexota bacterium]HUM67371.1 GAF domain-containing protein [Chloroflexota bacterium]
MRILYVEDNVQDAELTRHELFREMPEYELDAVTTLQAARQYLAEGRTYEAMLLDVSLPDGSGLDLLAELRAAGRSFPIIVLTGGGSEEMAVAALKAGADDYVVKQPDYYIRLPALVETAIQRHQAAAARHSRPLRVLYAEDNAADIDLTRHHFSRHAPHIRLDVVPDISNALARLPLIPEESCPYDVLLLDYNLPGLNALDALKIIRQERRLALPVILITGQGSEEVAVNALNLGAADYLVKHASYLFKLPAALENAYHLGKLLQEQIALRESEARFRMLAEQAQDIIYRYRLRPTPGFEYVSPAVTTITGYTPQEHYADPELGQKLVYIQDRHLLHAYADTNMAGRPLLLRWQHKDGRIIWTEQRNTPVYNNAGQLVAVEGIARDVTEREEVAQALAAQAERQTLLAVLGQLGLTGQDLPDLLQTSVNRLTHTLHLTSALLWEWQRPQGTLQMGYAAGSCAATARERSISISEPSLFAAALEADDGLAVATGAWSSFPADGWLRNSGITSGIAQVIHGRQGIFGVLAILSTRPEFTRQEIAFLQQAANLIGLMVARYQAEEDLRQRIYQLSILHQIDQEILAFRPAEEVLHKALGLVRDIVACSRSSVMLLDEETGEGLVYAVHRDGETAVLPGVHTHLPMGDRQQLATGKPLLYDLSKIVQPNPMQQQLSEEGIRMVLGLPLLVQGKLIGLFYLGRIQEEAFIPEEISIAQGVAGQISLALQNANLVSRLERRVVELSTLHQLGQRLQRVLPFTQLAKEIAQVLSETFDYEYICVWLIEEPDRLIPFVHTAHGQAAQTGNADGQMPEMNVGQGIVGWVAQHGQSVCLNNAAADPRYYPLHEGIQSELCVPLLTGEIAFGVISVETSRANAYDTAEQQLLETIAAQIAIAIQNAQLLDRERQSQEQLRSLTNYLQTAREAERAHIAREIHDEFGQMLTVLKMDIVWLSKRLPLENESVQEKAQEMSHLIDQAINTVRNLAAELRPSLLDDLGLIAALEWQAHHFSKRADIACTLDVPVMPVDLGLEANIAVFRIFQEALTNIARHADATQVTVTVRQSLNQFSLTVKDNGRGIKKSQLNSAKSLGLVGIQERARSLGGTAVVKGRPGRGTTMTLQLPVIGTHPERQG